ncbi:DUF1850 domain-containing protein [Natranaerofaba carboxydovora]|uniref:DUF1850 domain-containing protein n=1 Tax=Natranaerofaba carboxydovora TaxID=2742683 RepID=UPI001F144E4F|nr:DUF1850 domain-containing protein [Natranaerofaba carboxydovora]UMZ73699.1 hypothetical protein ACONDI_01264 [Natranaerofaba carboxydovora]
MNKIKSKFLILIMVLIFATTTIVLSNTKDTTKVILKNVETGEILFSNEVELEDQLKFTWIHSIDKLPWMEYFEVTDNQELKLNKVVIQDFGAGVPHNLGNNYEIRDGKILFTEINKAYQKYEWLSSQIALEKVELNGNTIITKEKSKDFQRLKLFLQTVKTPF